MSEATIVTGQFVRIRQPFASVGERLLARLIDAVLQVVYVIGISVLVSETHLFRHISGGVTLFFVILLVYLPVLCYSPLFELFNRGQTPGKRLLNLRVVKADGSVPTPGDSLLRWILYLVDVPLTSGLGLLFVLLGKKHQRIGDLAAGTIVIKEKSYRRIQVSLDEFAHLGRDYRPVYPAAADLSLEQVNIIGKALAYRLPDRLQRLSLLSGKVRTLLSISRPTGSDEQFLQTIVRDYQYYALEEV